MRDACAIQLVLACGRSRRDRRWGALLRSHLAPAERRGVLVVQDLALVSPGATPADIAKMLEAADVLLLVITPEYYSQLDFRDVVSIAAKRKRASNDGMVVGVYPVPFETARELDWLPAVPDYSKSTGRPRPSKADVVIAQAAHDILKDLEVDDSHRFDHHHADHEVRVAAVHLRRAYRIAELRRKSPRTVANVEALHSTLRSSGEPVAGDFLDQGRYGLLFRRDFHGRIEEWAALDRRSRVPVRLFILTDASAAELGLDEETLQRVEASTSALCEIEPSTLVAPLRHERGLGWFLVARPNE